VTDYFAMLDEPRRPWLDPEQLKEKFHRLAVEQHPDVKKTSEADFQALNTAYQILSDPVRRLRHWLELENPEALTASAQIPLSLIELFLRIGQTRAALDQFLTKEKQRTSPLARAMLMSEKLALADSVSALVNGLNQKRTDLLTDLETAAAGNPSQLAALYQQLAFISKWSNQTSEALLHLNLSDSA
jgi:curved DNA-binding protein CbpA